MPLKSLRPHTLVPSGLIHLYLKASYTSTLRPHTLRKKTCEEEHPHAAEVILGEGHEECERDKHYQSDPPPATVATHPLLYLELYLVRERERARREREREERERKRERERERERERKRERERERETNTDSVTPHLQQLQHTHCFT
jgi:hypothetical protein